MRALCDVIIAAREDWDFRVTRASALYITLYRSYLRPHSDLITEPIEAKLDAMKARFVARSLGSPAAMEGLWPAGFEGSQEEMGTGRHRTDHNDRRWGARCVGRWDGD